ncbi:ankyrin repeat domain-containing protein [Pseudonocardia acaciae]|uniref:ankyrin repeat domain-containing protein n=1 Tax=Pseudonocardia acaciae TaxID=551276 RepID=UPI001B802C08|nr:ankyrin repeat domain-containing protein [Pseudonocardia acaciae]
MGRYTRAPHREPVHEAGPDRLLRLACLTYADEDTPARLDEARRLLATNPELATANIHTMAAVGEVAAAAVALADDPSLANAEGGPFDWPPLLYLAYSRLDGPGQDTLGVARLLLVNGADPNAGYLWEGLPSPFTALTGALGGGESDQPPHQHELALTRLLLEAGADANDSQALYNRAFAGPGEDRNDWLELLLAHGLGRGSGGPWHQRMGPMHPTPAKLLQDALLHAAAEGLPNRVRLLLTAGVDVHGLGTEHPITAGWDAYELAMLSGNMEVAGLLREAGARAGDPMLEFVARCMRGDRDGATRLLADDPSLTERAVAAHPALVCRAAELGRLDAVRLLASLGFAVNPAGARTPLHEAAWRGDLPMVRALLELGADPDAEDAEHRATPSGWAEYNEQREVVEYLASHTPRLS